MATILAEPKTTAEDLLQVSFPILKWEEDADGDLIVKGIATDGTVDADEQIVDPVWSAKALNTWSATGANVRQSHDPRHPVGKGLSVEIDRNGSGKHWVTSVIVDPLAQKLVKKGVLTAYSIGIARPVIKHDPTGRARGGVIVGGELAELSIVDRPSNKSSYLEIAKSAANGDIEFTGKMFADDEVLAKFAGADLAKSYTENTVTIPEDKQDRQLTEKLVAEWPGILAWAVRGCLEWQAHQCDLEFPEQVEEATAEYRGDSDETVQEIAACLSDGEGYFYEDVETGATVRVGPA